MSIHRVSRPGFVVAMAAAGVVASALDAPQAIAQGSSAAPNAGSGSDAALDEIVVTGTRIQRSGFDAPTPTQIVDAEALAQRGATNVGEYLNEVPAFRTTTNNQTNPQSSQGSGQNFADLRALGNIRTLTLVDGRRHVPSSALGQVDLNMIPTVLVERIDVVTGGASAAYGSDAVSGVVNVILDKRLQGVRASVTAGLSGESDNFEREAALAYGTSFAGERGRFIIGGEYLKTDGVDDFTERDWGREQPELVSYVGARPAGAPSRFYARGVQNINMAYGGVIVGNNADTTPGNGVDVLRGIQFGPGGTVIPFPYGDAIGTASTNFSGGNAGLYARDGHQLVLPVTRYTALAHADYEFSEALRGFIEAGYARSGADFHTPPTRDQNATNIVIRRDNAFLPAQILGLMVANNIQTFGLGRANNDFGEIRARNYNDTTRVAFGLEGDLGENWGWDAYAQWGENVFDSTIRNLRIEQNFRFAYDAIRDPVSGQIICRDAAARAAGCVPLNLFGPGAASAAALAYVGGTQVYEIETTQSVAAANLRGEPFSSWAGPVSLAIGGEFREEEAEAIVDAIATANGFNYGNPKPFSGSYDVKEAYFETVVPLAAEAPLARSLEFNGAVRYTDYSTSGGVTTWKAGLTWEPIGWLRFRGTRSRDIRAPNNSELFAQTSNFNTLRNPFSGATGQIIVVARSSPDLVPEEADTTTIGFVVQPESLPNLRASVDFYDIEIGGAISSYAPQLILDNCFAEVGAGRPDRFCSFVARTGSGAATAIQSVSAQLLNIASVRTRGVDFEVGYRFELGERDSLSARLYGTYVDELLTDDGAGLPRTYNAAGVIQSVGSIVDRAGQVGGFTGGITSGATGAPEWMASGSLTWKRGAFASTIQGRYVDGGTIDNSLVGPGDPDYNAASPISVGSNRVASRFYVNLSASLDLPIQSDSTLQVFGLVSNLTDRDPPFPATALSGLYDRIGRTYRVGLRYSF